MCVCGVCYFTLIAGTVLVQICLVSTVSVTHFSEKRSFSGGWRAGGADPCDLLDLILPSGIGQGEGTDTEAKKPLSWGARRGHAICDPVTLILVTSAAPSVREVFGSLLLASGRIEKAARSCQLL